MKKYNNFIFEKRDDDLIKNLLLENCQQFLTEMKGAKDLFWRGFSKPLDYMQKGVEYRNEYLEFKTPKERQPRDTNKEMHDSMNDISEDIIGWQIRNGVFATMEYDNAELYTEDDNDYGDVYLFVPVGGFNYAYNPDITDFTNKLDIDYMSSYQVWRWKLEQKDVWERHFKNLSEKELKNRWEVTRKNYLRKLVDGYKTKDLKFADGVEVSFDCNSYYLIQTQYKDLIYNLIKQ